MKLSAKGQYAVMALTDIAQYGKTEPVALTDIALRQSLPLPYLEKLFGQLRHKGLVISSRGNKGGYTLSLDPEELSVLDIINAVEEPIKTTRCESKSPLSCQGKTGRCLTHHLWKGLGLQIAKYLRTVSLDDVIHQRFPNDQELNPCI